MKSITIIAIVISCSVIFHCVAQKIDVEYPDKTHPKESPRVFAEGLVSNPATREGALSFSPDGKSLVFTKAGADNKLSLQMMVFKNGRWSQPEQWEQSNVANSAEASFSPDGNTMYFTSNRFTTDEKGSPRISRSERDGDRWTTPTLLDLRIETDKGFWFPTLSSDQKLYFGAFLDSIGNFGKSDLYVTDLTSSPPVVKNLGPVINSPDEEWDPYISPDGSYLLFESDRPGGFGKTDVYVSFKLSGEWQKPINLGPGINSSVYEVAAKVSPDGKYIFFDRPMKDEQDIHWFPADVLDLLKQEFEKGTVK